MENDITPKNNLSSLSDQASGWNRLKESREVFFPWKSRWEPSTEQWFGSSRSNLSFFSFRDLKMTFMGINQINSLKQTFNCINLNMNMMLVNKLVEQKAKDIASGLMSFSSLHQGHHELSRKSDENKSFKPNQIVPSIYIMIELCFFSLDKWEIKIHLL